MAERCLVAPQTRLLVSMLLVLASPTISACYCFHWVSLALLYLARTLRTFALWVHPVSSSFSMIFHSWFLCSILLVSRTILFSSYESWFLSSYQEWCPSLAFKLTDRAYYHTIATCCLHTHCVCFLTLLPVQHWYWYDQSSDVNLFNSEPSLSCRGRYYRPPLGGAMRLITLQRR